MLAKFIYHAFSLRLQLADRSWNDYLFYYEIIYCDKIIVYNFMYTLFHLYDTWTLFESFAK